MGCKNSNKVQLFGFIIMFNVFIDSIIIIIIVVIVIIIFIILLRDIDFPQTLVLITFHSFSSILYLSCLLISSLSLFSLFSLSSAYLFSCFNGRDCYSFTFLSISGSFSITCSQPFLQLTHSSQQHPHNILLPSLHLFTRIWISPLPLYTLLHPYTSLHTTQDTSVRINVFFLSSLFLSSVYL